MTIHPVKTDKDYRKALLRIEGLIDATANSKAGDELDVLVTLVEAYERDHFPINSPDPVAAILFRMEQMGLDRQALEPFLGGRSRVSEVLNRKRSLSMSQIRKLHDGLNIPLAQKRGPQKRQKRQKRGQSTFFLKCTLTPFCYSDGEIKAFFPPGSTRQLCPRRLDEISCTAQAIAAALVQLR